MKEQTKETESPEVKETGLIPVDELKKGITEFSAKKESLEALAKSAAEIILDPEHPDYDEASASELSVEMWRLLRDERIVIEKLGKSLRDVVTPITKGISAKEKELIGITEVQEKRMKAFRDFIEAKKEEEKKKKQAERDSRIQKRTAIVMELGMAFNGVRYIINDPDSEIGKDDLTIEQLEIINFTEEQMTAFLEKLQAIHDKVKAREQELEERK